LSGCGIAYAQRSGAVVAIVAEVDRHSGRVWARKFTVAHDCGSRHATPSQRVGGFDYRLAPKAAQILEERVNNGRYVCWVAAPDGAQMELIEKV
jgi:hypothetical protein